MFVFIFICIILLINIFIYFISITKEDRITYYRDIPSDENPAIIGLMVKENIDGNDIVATLLDLNSKGYIDISYEGDRSVLKLTDKDRFLSLKDYENYLLDEIFKDSNEVVFDEFVSSSKFREVFKTVGEMIQKRVSFKSLHNISHKRNYGKINFLTNFIIFGFAFIYPILNLLFNDNVIIPLLLSYVISYFIMLLYKIVIDDKRYRLDQLIVSSSIALSILGFGLIFILFIIDNMNMSINQYLNIVNTIVSVISIFSLIIVDKNKYVDYFFILFGIISIPLFNYVGISLAIIYLSRSIYMNMPNHVNLKSNLDIDKWLALKEFLDDFTLIKDREAKEVKLWDKYLIYGISMGVNKKTIEEYSNMLNLKLINKNFIDKYYVENINY